MNNSIFLRYVCQNIAGMLGLSCYILVDTLFVSTALGAGGLAALNLSITVFSIVSGIGQLLGVGCGTDYALRSAEGKDASRSLPTALTFGAVWAFSFALLGLFAAESLSRLLGADETTLGMTVVYVRTTLLFAPAYLFNAILQGFVRNDGAPRLAMLSLLASSGMNILLDYLFMFPLGMGMFGAVFATGLSACLSTPILLSHFARQKHQLPRLLPLYQSMRLLSYGLSALIGELASAVSLLTFNLLLMRMGGYIGVAAYGVIANAALVATSIFTGLGQGIQPLASQALGSGDRQGMRALVSMNRTTVMLLSAAIFAAVFLFAQPIASAFNHEHNPQLQSIAAGGLQVYFSGYLFAGINIAASAFLSAIGWAGCSLIISLLRSCVLLIPMAMLLSACSGITGVWLSFVATEALCCILSLVFMKKAA